MGSADILLKNVKDTEGWRSFQLKRVWQVTEKARVRKPIGRQGLGKWHFRPAFIVQCPSSCSDAWNWTGMLQGTPRQTEPGQFTENADKYKPHGLKAK